MENSNIILIRENSDWQNLKEESEFVDINNDSYFGLRSMEKQAKHIIYDPNILDSKVRLIKYSKKYPDTIHVLIFNKETIGYGVFDDEEKLTKEISNSILELVEMNNDLKIQIMIIDEVNNDYSKTVEIIGEIYPRNIKK